jgi:predicted dehydrogenase
VPGTTDLDPILADPSITALVVSASAAAHEPLALAALAAGKHTYVEKPLALSVEGAQRIVAAAKDAGRTLMVGHLLLYHPAVEYLKALLARGELGDIHYLYSQRVNLGVVRRDENALWSFGPHDVSVMNHLVGATPESVTARGQAYLQRGVEDVVFVNLRYPGGRMGHIQLSWLDPHKIRRLTLVGTRKMAVFDDMDAGEKVRIYDKGAEVSTEYATYGEYLGIRHGDVVILRIAATEPLAAEARHFLQCVREGQTPRSDGAEGLAVVRTLEAASESLARDGAPVAVPVDN